MKAKCFAYLKKGRANRDVHHTKSVVFWMKELIDGFVLTIANLSDYVEGLPISSYDSSLAEPYYIAPSLGNGCKVIGCNSELCVAEDTDNLGTICVWQPWFACYSGAVCQRQSDNECGWTQTAELQQCLAINGGN